MAYSDQLSEFMRSHTGQFSIAARNLVTGEEIGYCPDQPMPTASVFKLPVLVELSRRAAAGEIDLEACHVLAEADKAPGSGVLRDLSPGLRISQRDLAMLMIIISDNTAADLCLAAVGLDRVNRTMGALGLTSTVVAMGCRGLLAHCAGIRANWPTVEQTAEAFRILSTGYVDYDSVAFQGLPTNNVTTGRDMVDLLTILFRQTALTPDACQFCLDVLQHQQLRDRIPLLLPEGTVTMTKSGTLGAHVVNDVGIVVPKQGDPYAVAILTDSEEQPEWPKLPAQISKVIYEHFQGR